MSRESPNPNLGAMLLDICRPDGVPARTACVMASIENARMRVLQAQKQGMDPVRFAGLAAEEFAKIFTNKDAYDRAMGLQP